MKCRGTFIKWKNMMEIQTSKSINHLKIDNSSKYVSNLFAKIYEDEGIIRHFTVKLIPQHNGVAEHMIKHCWRKFNACYPMLGWVDSSRLKLSCMLFFCHLMNTLLSTAIEGKTSLEKWREKPTTDNDLACVCFSYYHVKETKLDPQAKKAMFLGITSCMKGFCLWCPKTRKIIFSRDITLDESTM